MKAAARALIVVAVAAAVVVFLFPYWHALTLILRAAGTPGLLGQAARWDAPPVSDRLDQIPTPDGFVRARVFRPAGRSTRAALLVSGVHPDGIDEPRLVALARDLAGSGLNVLTPEIPDLMRYRLTARVTDTIELAALWLVEQQDLSGGNPVAMIGVSFSGGLSVVAAGRPALRDHVAYVLSFGGHGNLPRVLQFFCTGVEPAKDGGPGVRRPPHDFALAVLLHQAAALAVPSDQVGPLRDGVETFLQASSLARIDQNRATEMFLVARELQKRLPEPSATLMQLVNDRNVAALGPRLLPYLDRLGQDPALSPDRSPSPSAPVFLLHGTSDNVIPAVESELLADQLRKTTRVRTLLSGFLTHVDVSNRPSPAEAWQMIAFWKAVLEER